MAARAVADRVPVVLALLELPALGSPLEHAQAGLLLRQPGSSPAASFISPSWPDHGQLREPVVAADLEVDRVVTRRDLERAGAELGLHPLVRDHRHAPLDEGDDDLLADEVAVALVVGMDATATSARIVAAARSRP